MHSGVLCEGPFRHFEGLFSKRTDVRILQGLFISLSFCLSPGQSEGHRVEQAPPLAPLPV